ncbi:molybdate ABC transporter substrate-binding protein [Cellulomonas sp. DKR-3]|uniref:Molybdate ABC transporter substrate-binding protein n=2 Tax=Cellulomonas fulva TaxID=2835530 RepID=A0ABS5TZE6_9CELL|nr:molybdate ABC transporter substrate-binding protein [Cellulomonas fulva]
MTVPRGAAILVVAALAVSACGSSDGPGSTSTTSTTGTTGPAATGATDLRGELTVFAAASLEPALDEVAAAFVAEHPGVTVAPVRYDGSSTLATQLLEGAPADVLATADLTTMESVVDADLTAGDAAVFTTNTLQVVVPAGNPEDVASLADLAALSDEGGKVVLCAPEVPCGAAARTVLGAAGVTVTPASLEQNVTAVLTKVQTGEADAGLVYRTDVLKAGDDVVGVDVPEAAEAVNAYPAVALADAHEPRVAAAFVAFLRTDPAQDALAAHGFVAP